MKELINLAETIGKSLVDSPEQIRVTIEQSNGKVLIKIFSLNVNENCQLVGQKATLAKAARVILQSAAKNLYGVKAFILMGPRISAD